MTSHTIKITPEVYQLLKRLQHDRWLRTNYQPSFSAIIAEALEIFHAPRTQKISR
jgi:hypothetical protein